MFKKLSRALLALDYSLSSRSFHELSWPLIIVCLYERAYIIPLAKSSSTNPTDYNSPHSAIVSSLQIETILLYFSGLKGGCHEIFDPSLLGIKKNSTSASYEQTKMISGKIFGFLKILYLTKHAFLPCHLLCRHSASIVIDHTDMVRAQLLTDCLSRVMHTAEIVSVEWCIPQSCLRYCVLNSWEIWNNWLRGLMHTAEIDSAVGCTLRRLTPRWDAHNRVY